MKVKSALQLLLASGLLPFCSNTLAAQAAISANGGSTPEFAWLLGAVVLGFSVVARRSPRPFKPGLETGREQAPLAPQRKALAGVAQ